MAETDRNIIMINTGYIAGREI